MWLDFRSIALKWKANTHKAINQSMRRSTVMATVLSCRWMRSSQSTGLEKSGRSKTRGQKFSLWLSLYFLSRPQNLDTDDQSSIDRGPSSS